MRKVCILLTLMVFYVLTGEAQTYQKTSLGLKATVHSVDVDIQFFSPSIIRIVKTPAGKGFIKESLSVVKKPVSTKVTVAQKGDVVTLKSELVQVNLDLKSGKVSFANRAG